MEVDTPEPAPDEKPAPPSGTTSAHTSCGSFSFNSESGESSSSRSLASSPGLQARNLRAAIRKPTHVLPPSRHTGAMTCPPSFRRADVDKIPKQRLPIEDFNLFVRRRKDSLAAIESLPID